MLADRPEPMVPMEIPSDFPLNIQFQIKRVNEDVKKASPDQLKVLVNDLLICWYRAQLSFQAELKKGLE